MSWQPDALLGKAKLYIERGLEEDREDPLFPFWISLALEFLARSALATKHPTLLAAPERNMENVLYALGGPAPKSGPQSIPASVVFQLCKQLVPGFGPDEAAVCESLAKKRNEELHSGGLPFDDFYTASWLARFYRAAKVLLAFQGQGLAEFVGGEEAKAAEEMILAAEKEAIERVKKSLAAHRVLFEEKDNQAALLSQSEAEANAMSHKGGHKIQCPACGAVSWVTGERISSQGAKYEDGQVVERDAMLPTAMTCIACGLKLTGHHELQIAGVGGQYTHTSYYDPIEYHAQGTAGEEYDNE
jgi:hypothetical protein